MKKKLLSLLTAFAMVFGILAAPFTSAHADNANHPVTVPTGNIEEGQLSETKPGVTEVDIYKLTTKENYKAGAPWEHTGGKITPNASKQYDTLGDKVEALAGAKFTFYKINVKVDKSAQDTDKDKAKTKEKANVLNEKYLNIMKGKPGDFNTAEKMQDVIDNGYPKTGAKTIPAGVLEKATGEGLNASGDNKGETTNETDANGLATVKLADGYYWAVESKTPDKVTGAKGVPFGLTLPLMNGKEVTKTNGEIVKAGRQYLKKIYIYPKNVQTDKVKIDKNHSKFDAKTGKWVDAEGNAVTEDQLGLDFDNYQNEKKKISKELGQDAPYESETVIPRNYTFDSFAWIDTMSEGLTYNKNLVVTIDYTDADGKTIKKDQPFIDMTKSPKVNADMVTERDNGYEIKVTKEKVKDTLVEYLKSGPVTFHFKYSAKVNNKAVVDKPQSNSITFIPKEPKGVPDVKSKEGKIEIKKSWKKKNEDVTPGAKNLTYYVEDQNGKTVASVTVKSDATAGTVIPAANGIKFTVGANLGSGTFEGLPDGTYKVREAVDGYLPTYTKTIDGEVDITNEDNPDVKKPREPEVEFHGKKFVKTDQLKNEDRLFGAEFIVKNNRDNDDNKGKYLVVKNDTEKVTEIEAVKQAKKNLDDKIKAYNELSADQQKAQKSDYDTAIEDLQKKYNDAVLKQRTKFEWGDKSDALRLVSDNEGRFEITGLVAGKYELVEVTAPAGYALNEDPVAFTVNHGTYTKDNSEKSINYNKADTNAKDAQRVDNKKVTIPQTGGIGSLVFVVAGIAIMGVAFIAYKKSQAQEA